MSEETNGKLKDVPRIVIEYDPADGKFNLYCNISDEVLTQGMMAMASDKLKENYIKIRFEVARAQQANGIITDTAGLKV